MPNAEHQKRQGHKESPFCNFLFFSKRGINIHYHYQVSNIVIASYSKHVKMGMPLQGITSTKIKETMRRTFLMS
jgi:hypothetical protein